ncbi:putative dynamin family protein [Magnetofaba australis IT-1]|uniref:Putative dynamin family protein n=2 Tax=Magnetofaba TaxID=1472292 RepID=A0A1Y2K4L9_9PROT|nr:putative dynamin family protein [Magnetofaba australis IT-1]
MESLEKHLKEENPILLQAVQRFRELDAVAYRMGILDPEESYATRVPWWPLISVLGTFSAGKSTFINSFLNSKLQRSGNQAVDDKFTVICFSQEEESRTLPGLALDADPRFPFYQVSRDIESVAAGEGRRIDAYLQLKTCPSEAVRGKILVDSPGFDADAQRDSTLRITDHIMDLSDLVLVFFDARHPEPGAMRDTLSHLVKNTIHRPDSNKFLFVLNQVDCTVSEDNLEDVVAAWQRSMSQSGLTAGRFYQIYNEEAATPIEDPAMRERYQSKSRADLAEINDRIGQVETERVYRIVGVLEFAARLIQDELAPKVGELLKRWRKMVLIGDAVVLGLLAILSLTALFTSALPWPAPNPAELDWTQPEGGFGIAHFGAALSVAVVLGIAGYLHGLIRKFSAKSILSHLPKEIANPDLLEATRKSFRFSTRPGRFLFLKSAAGWGGASQRGINDVLTGAAAFVQDLNDQFTNPSGDAPNPVLEKAPKNTPESADSTSA